MKKSFPIRNPFCNLALVAILDSLAQQVEKIYPFGKIEQQECSWEWTGKANHIRIQSL